MTLTTPRCLILACGNTLRSDDGVGLWLACWAEERFHAQAGVRVIARQQWTPELTEDLAHSQFVLFIDCSLDSEPGSVKLSPVEPAAGHQALATHHQGAAELLALTLKLYNSLPSNAQLLTIGAGSTELGEKFSDAVTAALPSACKLLEETVMCFLSGPKLPEMPRRA
jgi:hydrogenase maturation protease